MNEGMMVWTSGSISAGVDNRGARCEVDMFVVKQHGTLWSWRSGPEADTGVRQGFGISLHLRSVFS